MREYEHIFAELAELKAALAVEKDRQAGLRAGLDAVDRRLSAMAQAVRDLGGELMDQDAWTALTRSATNSCRTARLVPPTSGALIWLLGRYLAPATTVLPTQARPLRSFLCECLLVSLP